MKQLRFKPYPDESAQWPAQGRVILAQYDEDSVVVYRAYKRQTGRYAVKHGQLGEPRLDPERMIWIEPSFLGVMFRSAWATAPEREGVLAIWMRRDAFDLILAQAAPSQFDARLYESQAAWQAALKGSEVRVQWNPDYSPKGVKLRRRAIQLGLRGETLRRCVTEWIMQVEDISSKVRQQSAYVKDEALLLVPAQRVYPVHNADLARRLGLDKWGR